MSEPSTEALPPALVECVAAIDREIAEYRADMEQCQNRIALHVAAIERCEAIKHAYRHAAEILAAGASAADPVGGSMVPKQRRDLRAEVRQCIADAPDGVRPAEIATRLQIRRAQVESALAWLRSCGELAPPALGGEIRLKECSREEP